MSALGQRPLVLSPHLDDAVLSLGAAIAASARAGAETTVLTVFGCDPLSDAPAGWWDRRAGFQTEGEAARARRDEDARACARLGATPRWLPFRDATYPPRPAQLAVWTAIVDAAADTRADTVLVPGFPLRHPDHAWLAALVLARSLPDVRVGLYVEQPYTWRLGASPNGGPPWERLPAAADDRAAKRRAAGAYRTQLPLLGRLIPARISLHEARLGGEAVAWLGPAPALRVLDGGADPGALKAQIDELVLERQALRESSATEALLEQNRREIARLQRELSQALIAKYAPARQGPRLTVVPQPSRA
jgi:LmbE family N-acetylglucosaminyl deacetylase